MYRSDKYNPLSVTNIAEYNSLLLYNDIKKLKPISQNKVILRFNTYGLVTLILFFTINIVQSAQDIISRIEEPNVSHMS